MLVLGDLLADPNRIAELKGDDVLVAAGGTGELLVRDKPRAREATMVFQHETIQMMKAERVDALDKLRNAVGPASAVVPLRQKPGSLWDAVTVGRAETADIVIEDPAVSSVHAHFVRDSEGDLSLHDVGSSNGTFINRKQMQAHTPVLLKSGDCLRFGQTVFYYVSSSMLKELSRAR